MIGTRKRVLESVVLSKTVEPMGLELVALIRDQPRNLKNCRLSRGNSSACIRRDCDFHSL